MLEQRNTHRRNGTALGTYGVHFRHETQKELFDADCTKYWTPTGTSTGNNILKYYQDSQVGEIPRPHRDVTRTPSKTPTQQNANTKFQNSIKLRASLTQSVVAQDTYTAGLDRTTKKRKSLTKARETKQKVELQETCSCLRIWKENGNGTRNRYLNWLTTFPMKTKGFYPEQTRICRCHSPKIWLVSQQVPATHLGRHLTPWRARREIRLHAPRRGKGRDGRNAGRGIPRHQPRVSTHIHGWTKPSLQPITPPMRAALGFGDSEPFSTPDVASSSGRARV